MISCAALQRCTILVTRDGHHLALLPPLYAANVGFTLRKWNCSNPLRVGAHFKDTQSLCNLMKTLVMDHLKIADLPPIDNGTEHFLISDVH
jgi:hypothetical protein